MSVDSTVRAALDRVRADFERALAGEGTDGNGFTVLHTPLRADQVRGIASSVGGDVCWRQSSGKRLLGNDTIGVRLFLGFLVGSKRHFRADGFVELLAELCRPEPRHYPPEPYLAQFVNLTAVEAHHHPERELVVWVTVAHKLATGHPADNLYADLPDLVTDHDMLCSEIPPGAPYSENLLPDPARTDTMPRYQARLLAEVLPRLADRAATLATDEERAAIFAEHAGELRSYADAEIFPRVATELGEATR